MTDRRACFDFEVDFSNGGGIQGQGFRLDIAGDDIDDDALAAYIIRDLRLLMVGEVRILNKRIMEERHKRSAHPAADVADGAGSGSLIDLSHTIEDGMVTYKGLPAPLICDHLSRERSRTIYAEGTEFQIGRIDMVANTGTYIDTPFHRYADGHDLAGLPLRKASGLPGVVVRLEGAADRAIDWHAFAATQVKGRAVLVHTGWDRHWRTDAYFEGHPFLTEKAAEYLRDQGAELVGIDSFNIDDISGGERPVHTVLLGAGIPIVEHMTGLSRLPNEGFTFWAVPPKVAGMGTFPVRAHARLDAPAA
ncbi:cyclase family protein [Agrilutibacter solisilvae]|uniref:Cyclase family protein n=1 Tax=Agrilutibacter solisilvae TaxID=2763317 RepID=A0A974XZN0_9GAMM|nr:cyclase family protein [Lysobacter solisilvae]QSX78717.1 cyclase family protein [Lysobacter solisilvae]